MAEWPYNTAAWQRLRTAKLTAAPLCYPCKVRGFVTMANAVDHITAIAAGGDPFPPLSGLMSMCERCHNEKTAATDRPGSKPFARRFKGFDADGNPIDPADGWHGGASNHENEEGQGPAWENKTYLVSDENTNSSNDLGFD